MAQILVRDVGEAAVARLKRRAKRRGRSLQGEVKAILEEVAGREAAMVKARREAARIRARFAGRPFSDSTALIREDRER
jgi:plasmid stability protein